MNNTQIQPADQFLDGIDFESAEIICNQLIDNMIVANPNRKDMSRADWLNVIYNDYVAIVTEDGITFNPKSI